MAKRRNYKQNPHNLLILGGLILSVVVILITALLINQNRFDTNSKADFIDPRQTNCFRMCVDNNTDCNACLPNKKPIRLISARPIRSFPVVTVPPRTPLPTVEIN